MNYLGNAIKFTQDGEVEITLEVKKFTEDQNTAMVKIEVSDQGCGITEEDQKKLFAPFTMLSASKQLNPNGTGMGLSICKQIAEYMGGSCSVRSNNPRGSIFGF